MENPFKKKPQDAIYQDSVASKPLKHISATHINWMDVSLSGISGIIGSEAVGALDANFIAHDSLISASHQSTALGVTVGLTIASIIRQRMGH